MTLDLSHLLEVAEGAKALFKSGTLTNAPLRDTSDRVVGFRITPEIMLEEDWIFALQLPSTQISYFNTHRYHDAPDRRVSRSIPTSRDAATLRRRGWAGSVCFGGDLAETALRHFAGWRLLA